MRNLKKFLALVMAMVMAFSLMVSANAASKYDQVKEWTDKDQVTEEFVEAVDVLSGMKVFQGDEDGFRPGSTITRAETAALIYRLATGDVENVRAGLYANYGNFADVAESDWFAGYVGYCANAGYIKGKTATTFDPYASVTGYEALAMILRAVGYDKNGEFTGPTWQTNVSALGTRLGVLDDVKTSDYANTLHLASRRDVVASILFACANIPTVTYTPSLGYETNKLTDGTSDGLNGRTLGKVYFGLEKVEGIIVGNQDTGESNTRINYAAEGYDEHFGYFHQTKNWDEKLDKDGKASAAAETTVSVTIDAKTGVEMFGHKVKAWYADSNTTGAAKGKTFALYDNVKKTAVVSLAKDDVAALLSKAADGDAPLGKAAQNAGFKVDLKRSKAVYNMEFGISAASPDAADGSLNDFTTDYNTGGATDTAGTVPGVTTDAISVSNKNHGCDTVKADAVKYPLYLLISNSSDLKVDMVVALNVETSRITEVNNHAKYPTITAPNAATENTFVPAHDTTATDNGKIAQGALTATSSKNLKDPVVGIAIAGTNSAKHNVSVEDINGQASQYVQANGSPLESTYFYRLANPTQYVEGVVTQYKYNGCWGAAEHDNDDKHTGKIVIDGKEIERSPLADAITAGSGLSAEAELYGTYRAYLDGDGKYIYVVPVYGNSFVYGTYMDYATKLGSSTYEHTLVGVDMDGKQVVRTVTSLDGMVFGSDNSITGVTTMKDARVPYRDVANADATTSGVSRGSYTGFIIDEKGALTSETDVNSGTGADESGTDDDEVNTLSQLPQTVYVGEGDSSFLGAADGTMTIGTTAAKLGMVETEKSGLFFTNDTKFIIVDGAGTDTQKVEVLTGLTELLKGGSQVTIDGDKLADADDMYLLGTTGGTYLSNMMYYTKSPFVYASVVGNPEKIDTIFLPKDALTWNGGSSLYFVGNPAQDSQITVGPNTFHLYTMYENGEKVQKWLVNDPTEADDTHKKGKLLKDSFYELEATSFTTPGGETVYMAHDGTAAKDTSTGVAETLVTTGTDATAKQRPDLNGGAKPILNQKEYWAATYASQTASIGANIGGTEGTDFAVFNVAGAKVVNLNAPDSPTSAADGGDSNSKGYVWPGITDLASLNDAASTSAIYNGAGKFPKVSIQVDPTNNLQVTVIYINWNQSLS